MKNILKGKKTYIGIIIALIPTLAKLFGYDLSVEGAQELGVEIDALVTYIGLIIATYGRVVTKAK